LKIAIMRMLRADLDKHRLLKGLYGVMEQAMGFK
jgi:hypothetical protein